MTDRRLQRAIPITLVFVVVAVAFLLIVTAHWRKGAAVLGLAALIAAILRLALPESAVGPLAVRSKAFDVGFLTVLAVAMELLERRVLLVLSRSVSGEIRAAAARHRAAP